MSAAPTGNGDQPNDGAPPAENPTNSRKRSNENSKNDQPSAKRFACRFCTSVFDKSQALGGHMNRHRPDRENESLLKAHALVNRAQNKQLTASYTWNMLGGGRAATSIGQNPSGSATGIINPLQALRTPPSLNIPPGAYYQQPMGLTHSNMLVSSNSVMQPNNNMQKNHGIPPNSVMQSSNNLQQNLRIPLNSVMQSSNNMPQNLGIPSNSVMQSSNNLPLNLGIPSNSLMQSSNNVQQNPSNLHWNQDGNMNSNAPRASSNLTNEFGNSVSDHVHENAHWNEDRNMNSNALRDLNNEPMTNPFQNDPLENGIIKNEPMANAFHNDGLANEIISKSNQLPQDSLPHPQYDSFE